jgi:hypothetical protein
MKEYDLKTSPLLNIYQSRGVLTSYEAKKGIKDYPDLKKIIVEKLDQVKL